MGRHDAGRVTRAVSTSYQGSPRAAFDVKALQSPRQATPTTESQLLRQVLWVAVGLTAGAFLLLLISSGSSWKKIRSTAQVLVSSGVELAEANWQPVELPSDWHWDEYHNYTTTSAVLEWLQKSFPKILTLNILGKSVQGLQIPSLEITAPEHASSTYKPMFKWLGGMHGDEQPSVELLLRFAIYLAREYGRDRRVTQLLQAVRVQILPCLNQDGKEEQMRFNFNKKDLNRNFPMDAFNYKIGPASREGWESVAISDWRHTGAGPQEPETLVSMKWYQQNRPTFLSANVHGGALVANYPLDACDNTATTAPCPTEEGDLPLQLAQVYSLNHPTMHLNNLENFKNGTINGAVWYPVVGSLQDWVYHTMGGMHLTMELHEHHTKPEALPKLWEDNMHALMRFTEMVHMGLLLRVVDDSTATFLQASVRVLAPQHIRNATSFVDHQNHPATFKLMSPAVEYCLEVWPRGANVKSQSQAAEYAPVLVAAKLPVSLTEAAEREGVDGLRLEYTLNVGKIGSKEIVNVGAATGAACKRV